MFGKVCNSYNCIQECLPIFAQSYLTLCNPMDYTVYGILQARILEWLAFPFSRELPNPGIEPRSLALQADSLPAELQGKPKNTGVGSLCLLKGIFLTQEGNWGLLHCRWILYQLSYREVHGWVIFHCIYVFWFLMYKIKYSKVFNGYYISSSVPNTSQSLP